MTLSTKQKIILWVTVLLIVVFLGLSHELILKPNGQYTGKGYLTSYGFKLLRVPDSSAAYNITEYKYHLIIATLLIGLALFISVKGE